MNSKNCKYCKIKFYRKDFVKVFHMMITCGSYECKKKHKKEWTFTKRCPDCDKSIVYSANKCKPCISKGETNPFYGKTHSEETKKKIKLFEKGQISPRKGIKMSEEQKLKVSISRRGKCTGKEHHNWNGGSSFEPYGIEFNSELRDDIKKRDIYTCQLCNITQHQLNRLENNNYKKTLRVHHIDYDKKNNDPNNLISLCLGCHLKTNDKRKSWEMYFKNRVQGHNLIEPSKQKIEDLIEKLKKFTDVKTKKNLGRLLK